MFHWSQAQRKKDPETSSNWRHLRYRPEKEPRVRALWQLNADVHGSDIDCKGYKQNNPYVGKVLCPELFSITKLIMESTKLYWYQYSMLPTYIRSSIKGSLSHQPPDKRTDRTYCEYKKQIRALKKAIKHNKSRHLRRLIFQLLLFWLLFRFHPVCDQFHIYV